MMYFVDEGLALQEVELGLDDQVLVEVEGSHHSDGGGFLEDQTVIQGFDDCSFCFGVLFSDLLDVESGIFHLLGLEELHQIRFAQLRLRCCHRLNKIYQLPLIRTANKVMQSLQGSSLRFQTDKTMKDYQELQLESSSYTEILHHFVVLVLQHVTMPDVDTILDIEREGLPVVQTELHADDGHQVWERIYDVPKHPLISFRSDVRPNLIERRVHVIGDVIKAPGPRISPVELVPVFGVLIDIKFIALDFLHVDQVDMNRVSIRSQVDDVEVIDFAHIEGGPLAICPQLHAGPIDEHATQFLILACEFVEGGVDGLSLREVRIFKVLLQPEFAIEDPTLWDLRILTHWQRIGLSIEFEIGKWGSRFYMNFHDRAGEPVDQVVRITQGVRGCSIVLQHHYPIYLGQVHHQFDPGTRGQEVGRSDDGAGKMVTFEPQKLEGQLLVMVEEENVEVSALAGIEEDQTVLLLVQTDFWPHLPVHRHHVAIELWVPCIEVLGESLVGVIQFPVCAEGSISNREVEPWDILAIVLLDNLFLGSSLLTPDLVHAHQPSIHIQSCDPIGVVMIPKQTILFIRINVYGLILMALLLSVVVRGLLARRCPIRPRPPVRSVLCGHPVSVGYRGHLIYEHVITLEGLVKVYREHVFPSDVVAPQNLTGDVLRCKDHGSWKTGNFPLFRHPSVSIDSGLWQIPRQHLLCGLLHSYCEPLSRVQRVSVLITEEHIRDPGYLCGIHQMGYR